MYARTNGRNYSASRPDDTHCANERAVERARAESRASFILAQDRNRWSVLLVHIAFNRIIGRPYSPFRCPIGAEKRNGLLNLKLYRSTCESKKPVSSGRICELTRLCGQKKTTAIVLIKKDVAITI